MLLPGIDGVAARRLPPRPRARPAAGRHDARPPGARACRPSPSRSPCGVALPSARTARPASALVRAADDALRAAKDGRTEHHPPGLRPPLVHKFGRVACRSRDRLKAPRRSGRKEPVGFSRQGPCMDRITEQSQDALEPPERPRVRRSSHVVVVDDKSVVRDFLREVLELAGHRVTTVGGRHRRARGLPAGPAPGGPDRPRDEPHDRAGADRRAQGRLPLGRAGRPHGLRHGRAGRRPHAARRVRRADQAVPRRGDRRDRRQGAGAPPGPPVATRTCASASASRRSSR